MLYPKYAICASGAAETSHCGKGAFEKAEAIGAEIIRQGAIVVDGATTGFPYWVAKGAKSEKGTVIGISPAASELEHIKKYQLPTDFHDLIIYTGNGYSGRNLLLTRASDAVLVGCGRVGTLNEFTIAFEDDKPIGVLEGEWETDELIKEIIARSHRGPGKVVYDPDPKKLIEKVMDLIKKEKGRNGIK